MCGEAWEGGRRRQGAARAPRGGSISRRAGWLCARAGARGAGQLRQHGSRCSALRDAPQPTRSSAPPRPALHPPARRRSFFDQISQDTATCVPRSNRHVCPPCAPAPARRRSFFDQISQDTGKFVFGVKDTLACLEMGAVETLIVWENLDLQRYVFTNPATGER